MQAYATAERPASGRRIPGIGPTPPASSRQATAEGDFEAALLDQLLSRLADLVVDRLSARTAAIPDAQASDCMDARGAAAYLGMHRDTVRKLAAQRAIPAHQDGPRCKLYFRRGELDDWRCSARPARSPKLRAV
jgi:excisionase family DNA binding protein